MEETKKKSARRSSVKKTPAKKTASKKDKVAAEVAKEVEEVVEEKVVPTEQPREFQKDDLIEVKSVFAGSCTLVGRRSGNVYVWETLGEIQYVEYQDLLAEITNRYSKYIYEPLLLIEDEDVINKNPKLKDLYDAMIDVEEIEDSLLNDSVEELRSILITLPSGLKETVKSVASTLMQDGALYDVRKIRLLDDLYHTALSEQLSLYQ
ncbi:MULTISPECIES: hypothetical protein [unclassified Holdemanella]|uniref:hypothetical protein n=1 Tax=unclassified Holdemanella TaxID=2633909 RepID=UPI001D0A6596|nr:MULTISPECIES: hypothetical protein [unclassified Holdemanella]MCB8639977.1 hypothetical protein [Holdemanella sp. DFI.5.55]MCG5648942.1 hypothetical protein [Holdemanella sp. DFI.5.21]